VGRFRSTRASFRAIADALGFLEADSATTEYENGPVKPRLNVQASIEAGVNFSSFIFLRTDSAGGADTTVDIDVHVLGDWAEIRNRGVTFVGVAGTEVPPTHDAWIISVGIDLTVGAAIDNAVIFYHASTVGAGSSRIPLYFGDTVGAIGLLRGSVQASPIVLPLPWPILPVALQTHSLRLKLNTNTVVSTNLTLGVLSAPPGVFRRLY